MSPVISFLINESFRTGVYPDCLKLAKVTPIHKGGDKNKPGNYRPISILSNINKIFEKVFYSRLISFLNKNNVINDTQFGFRHGYSTTMAVAEFYERLLKSNDKGEMTCAVLLDLSKAFDSVNREILMYKLAAYGIRGNAWNLMNSYLENRSQFVCAEGVQSNSTNVGVGVPQGSVLGPLLFILHINDMQSATNMNVLNFADDTLLYMHFKHTNHIEDTVNAELEKINKWMQTNKLKINVSKTKFMLFSSNHHYSNIKLTIGTSLELEQVKEYKYLGLIIDSKLTWKSHVQYLRNKLSRNLGVLFKSRHYLNKKSLQLLFNSLFSSHISYGILCWGRCGKTTLDPLIRIVNKAIRCINFLKYTDTVKKYYFTEQFLPIPDIFNIELAKFMFKYNKGLLPQIFNSYFERADTVHTHFTRLSKDNYFLPRTNKTTGLNSLGFLGVRLWHGVPDETKRKITLGSFVTSYKHFLKNNYLSQI